MRALPVSAPPWHGHCFPTLSSALPQVSAAALYTWQRRTVLPTSTASTSRSRHPFLTEPMVRDTAAHSAEAAELSWVEQPVVKPCLQGAGLADWKQGCDYCRRPFLLLAGTRGGYNGNGARKLRLTVFRRD